MKFAQFIELEEKLHESGYTIDDLKKSENPNELILEFWGIKSKILRSGILGKSKKFQAIFAKQLKALEEQIKGKMEQYTKDLIQTRKSVKTQMKNIQKAGNPIPKEVNKQLMGIEGKIIKVIEKMVDKFAELKTQEINTRLDATKMKDKTRAKLDIAWESSLTDFKVGLLTTLYKQRVIETDAAAKYIKSMRNKAAPEPESEPEPKPKNGVDPQGNPL
jgi:hypothetical protein